MPRWTRCCGSSSAGSGVAIVPAMVLIDRPGLRAVRLEGPALERTISLARPADVAPTAAVDVMQRTITDTAHGVRGAGGGDHAARAAVTLARARSTSP